MDRPGSGYSTMTAVAVTAAAALVGLAAVYVTLGGADNAAPKPQAGAAAPAATAASKGLAVGEMAAFVFKKQPEPLAEVAFKGPKGEELTLASFKGRVVLLNLWATWCAPCRKEMPALDRLQKELGSPKFEVVALAVDRAGADAAGKFLKSIDVKNLALYVDATARSGTALKAVGMPTTILIDAAGNEVGRLAGAAEWDSADAKRLIASVVR